jgi:hypothetical protein
MEKELGNATELHSTFTVVFESFPQPGAQRQDPDVSRQKTPIYLRHAMKILPIQFIHLSGKILTTNPNPSPRLARALRRSTPKMSSGIPKSTFQVATARD